MKSRVLFWSCSRIARMDPPTSSSLAEEKRASAPSSSARRARDYRRSQLIFGYGQAAQALLRSSVCALRDGEAVGFGLGVASGVPAGVGSAVGLSMASEAAIVF